MTDDERYIDANEFQVSEKENKSFFSKNRLIIIFTTISLFFAIWFGSYIIGDPSCNAKFIDITKKIKIEKP